MMLFSAICMATKKKVTMTIRSKDWKMAMNMAGIAARKGPTRGTSSAKKVKVPITAGKRTPSSMQPMPAETAIRKAITSWLRT